MSDYLKDLQTSEAQVGVGKLRTLVLQFGASLSRFPALAQEMNAMLEPKTGVNYDDLVRVTEQTLSNITSFLLDVDFLDGSLKDAAEISNFLKTANNAMSLKTAAIIIERFEKLKLDVETKRASDLRARQDAETKRHLEQSRATQLAKEVEEKRKAEEARLLQITRETEAKKRLEAERLAQQAEGEKLIALDRARRSAREVKEQKRIQAERVQILAKEVEEKRKKDILQAEKLTRAGLLASLKITEHGIKMFSHVKSNLMWLGIDKNHKVFAHANKRDRSYIFDADDVFEEITYFNRNFFDTIGGAFKDWRIPKQSELNIISSVWSEKLIDLGLLEGIKESLFCLDDSTAKIITAKRGLLNKFYRENENRSTGIGSVILVRNQ